VGISIPSTLVDDLDLRDDGKKTKFISLEELERICDESKKLPPIDDAESERLTLFALSDPNKFDYAYDVFFFLASFLKSLTEEKLKNKKLVEEAINNALIALKKIASSTENITSNSVVKASTDFKYPEVAADFNRPNEAYFIITEKLKNLPEARDYFARQVAEAGIIARATLVQNKLLQGKSGALDESEYYLPERER